MDRQSVSEKLRAPLGLEECHNSAEMMYKIVHRLGVLCGAVAYLLDAEKDRGEEAYRAHLDRLNQDLS